MPTHIQCALNLRVTKQNHVPSLLCRTLSNFPSLCLAHFGAYARTDQLRQRQQRKKHMVHMANLHLIMEFEY